MRDEDETRRTAERVARHTYGRLIAYLTVRCRSIDAAEDALSEAMSLALQTWPKSGIPDSPEAWLLTVARRHRSHVERHAKTVDGAQSQVALMVEEAAERAEPTMDAPFPDNRLALFFVCAHPAIDVAARTPLMLQTVLGLSVDRLAPAFLVAPATMAQRLVRAKRKIAASGIPFSVPDREHWPERLAHVLDAIYAAYGLAWDSIDGTSDFAGLEEEAIWLARALVAVMPDADEAMSLLAAMLYAQSRRGARRDPQGFFVPLDEQDCSLWNADMIAEADDLLRSASRMHRFGRFQCEAAIQAVHAARRASGRTDWAALATLHRARCAMAPTVGATVAHAAVLGRSEGPEAGIERLNEIEPALIAAYQPYWAVRAHLLWQAGQIEAADEAYERAIGLAASGAVKRFLSDRRKAARAGAPPA